MAINLTGDWNVAFTKEKKKIKATISIPGTINGAGLGADVCTSTKWVTGLYNPFWYEREEYKGAQNGDTSVPFLAEPKTWFAGSAVYERNVEIEELDQYYLFIELTKWNVKVLVDDNEVGSFTSLCVPFYFDLGKLKKGTHKLTVIVDNSMIYPYRPDSHGISDSLGANWNGLCGKVCLYTKKEWKAILDERVAYAAAHPRKVEVKDCNFYVDNVVQYMRGTHFGGDYPLTGCAPTDDKYWDKFMKRIKEWGFNFIRCHSYCPPEAAFLAADKEDVYIQVECGMWNTFNPGDEASLKVLKEETKLILEAFGHHPSFIMLSPTNEPGGNWYEPLKSWVSWAKALNKKLGFEGRRIFTAQSGWFFDVPTAEITAKDTDYIYFHRSNYGPRGGMIRNFTGWNGKDYSICVEGAKLPVICHEMGQWCSYPDFKITKKFTGYLKNNMYQVFKARAKKMGVLKYNDDFVYCSGRNQVRLLKEEFEANLRTKELKGYEYLDMHDYLGQCGAFVGILDAFWDNKGYTTPEEIKKFNANTVILTRLKKYVYANTEVVETPVEISHYGSGDITDATLSYTVVSDKTGKELKEFAGKIKVDKITAGQNTFAGNISFKLDSISANSALKLVLTLSCGKTVISQNDWNLHVFVKDDISVDDLAAAGVVFTRNYVVAESAVLAGKKVIFNPYMSDLDYDCPVISSRNSFWNSQMGPRWSRNNGIVVDAKHYLFKYFPTDKSGGWQWEHILDNARGFNINPDYDNLVRSVDDWNRNFPLSVILEGRVGKGRMLIVSAELNKTFEQDPAVNSLKNAIFKYVLSDDFRPVQRLNLEDVKKHLMNIYKGTDIIEKVEVTGVNTELKPNPNDDKKLKRLNDAKNPELIKEQNPNYPYFLTDTEFPVTIRLKLKKKVWVRDLYYLAPQNDRDFFGVIKYYEVNGKFGTFKNRFEMQRSVPVNEITDEVYLTVLSTYGMGKATRWAENKNGWYQKTAIEPLYLQIAAMGIEFEEDNELIQNDIHFWNGSAASRHTEIDA